MQKKILIFITSLFLCLYFVSLSNAQILQSTIKDQNEEQLGSLRSGAHIGTTASIGEVAGYVIKGFLGLLSIIFIVLIIVAGYNWMTASGDESKVTYAKDTIKRAVIGIIIIVGAYAITAYVFQKLPMGSGNGVSPTNRTFN